MSEKQTLPQGSAAVQGSSGSAAAPYLLRVLPLLHVVEFVVLDVAVARERRLPGDGDGGGGAGEGADVGSGAGQLDCNTRGNSVSPEPGVPTPGQQPRKRRDFSHCDIPHGSTVG